MEDDLIPTRATLLERLKNWRDNLSWQEFFDTYWKLIYEFARRSGLNESEAQDVVQETMLSAAKHLPNFKYDRSLGSFKNWLLGMTRWRIQDQFRKRKIKTESFDHDHGEERTRAIYRVPDPVSVNTAALWEAEWEKGLLDAAIAKVKRRLEPEKYQIFDFLVNKQWPPQKVAETFKLTLDQVYKAKQRITDLIREEVERLNDGTF